MPTTFECFSGCRYVVQPILYEGDVMGRVVFGPFVPEDLVELPGDAAQISPRLRREARPRATSRRSAGCRIATAEKILKHFMDLLDVMVFTGHKNLIAAKLHIEAVHGELPRAAGQEPAARGELREAEGARPAQVELPRHDEPRAAHAAHERHRLLGDDARGARRAAHRRAARVPRHHHGEGREPPPAHHLHPRHLQDRGGPRAARALRGGRRPRSCATRSRRCCRSPARRGSRSSCEPRRAAPHPRRTATSSASAS